ncbi:hypothetical protein CBL_21435, partial [Carabus blaptoides fortunei]
QTSINDPETYDIQDINAAVDKLSDHVIRAANKAFGTSTHSTSALILKNSKTIKSPLEIANTLAQTFELNSSTKNFTQEFAAYKENRENHKTNNHPNENDPLNKPFSYNELTNVLKETRNKSSPGPD